MIFYYKYYLEIKNRLFLTLLCWMSLLSICYLYKEPLLYLFLELNNNTNPYFMFTHINEIFVVYLKLIFFISNQFTLWLSIYHLIFFISFGLYKTEYKKILTTFKLATFSWLLSISLLSYIILPLSVEFFLSFQQTTSTLFFFEAKIIEYFDYFTDLYLICVLSCQLLAGILNVLLNSEHHWSQTKYFRKLFYLIFLLFATIITPPDIISQIIIGSCLISFYELMLLISAINKVTN